MSITSVERTDHALGHELAEPWQVHGDQVIGAVLALGVAQDLLMQPVDGEGALVDVGADDLLELALEVLHDHEGRIAMHEDAQAAREGERRQERGGRRDRGMTRHVGATVEIVARVGLAAECAPRNPAHAAAEFAEPVEERGAGVEREAAPGFRPGTLLDESGFLQLGQLAHRRGIWDPRGRCHRGCRYQPPFEMPPEKVKHHVEMRIGRGRVERRVDLDAHVAEKPHDSCHLGLGHADGCGLALRRRSLSELDVFPGLRVHCPAGGWSAASIWPVRHVRPRSIVQIGYLAAWTKTSILDSRISIMDKKGRRGPTEIHLDNRRLHRAIPGLRGQRQSPDKNGRNEMTYSTKLSLACTTALIALGGAAAAQSVTIGITQNNVGVDSYQTTYERRSSPRPTQNPDVESRRSGCRRRRGAPDRADGGPDPAGSRCHHHLADQRRGRDPRRAQGARPASR
jgi:hypothetical protein